MRPNCLCLAVVAPAGLLIGLAPRCHPAAPDALCTAGRPVDSHRAAPSPAGEAGAWDAWEQVPAGQPRGKRHPETADWTATPDGANRTTPAKPEGAQSATEEGPYYRTREAWE